MELFCGIDWASDHHDVSIIDDTGREVARRRIGHDATGFTELLALLAEAGEDPDALTPVAIETDHGLLVAALVSTGRHVYPV